MQTFPSWQLIILPVLIIHFSLAERALGTQAGEKAVEDLTLSKPATTTDEFDGFAPQISNYESADPMSFNQDTAPILQTSNCTPQGAHAGKNRRARRGEIPIMFDKNPLANQDENGRAPPVASDSDGFVRQKRKYRAPKFGRGNSKSAPFPARRGHCRVQRSQSPHPGLR